MGQQFSYALEGAVKIYIHFNEIILNEEDSIFFEKPIYRNVMVAVNDKPAKFLAVLIQKVINMISAIGDIVERVDFNSYEDFTRILNSKVKKI